MNNIIVPSRKRAHYEISAHPPLWAQFPAKAYCLLEYVPMLAVLENVAQMAGL